MISKLNQKKAVVGAGIYTVGRVMTKTTHGKADPGSPPDATPADTANPLVM